VVYIRQGLDHEIRSHGMHVAQIPMLVFRNCHEGSAIAGTRSMLPVDR
jgi:hypothetical protein